MMQTNAILWIIFISQLCSCSPSFIFHENSNIMFVPEQLGLSNEYFGFSTLSTHDGVFIGAPRATNIKGESSGAVFHCSLSNLETQLIICHQLGSNSSAIKLQLPYELHTDVWFGATLAALNNNRLLVTAPRTKEPFDHKNLLLHGVNYILTQNRYKTLNPLNDGGWKSNQAFVADGKRREYGRSNTHIYFYAHGQVGFSTAVTKMNTIIFGAPGLLQWTGGIVTYTFNQNDTMPYTNLQPIVNPYYTMELEADDYFDNGTEPFVPESDSHLTNYYVPGYSVASGTFEKNGSVLYVGGAPRSKMAAGKVLVFKPPRDAVQPLDIRAKLIGQHAGSYFGATLCCTDINGDGLDDLLVGAPTYVENNGALPYDQGAVFVFITRESSSGFILEEAGYVAGSCADGARFGTAIADLGDINGDGFTDIAIGAPWEDHGIGAVYIYMGESNGLSKQNVQRIQPINGRGFGWSISKGLDLDSNNCNDLVVGAFNSASSYLYRCIPTMTVHPSIKLPNAVNLPHNVTTFTATFCVSAPSFKFSSDVKLKLIGKIDVDLEENRAIVIEDSIYTIIVTPGSVICDQRTIYVNLTADLLKPMLLTFVLEADEIMKDNSTTFLMGAARISNASTLKSSFNVQLMRDCGEDLLCQPWLYMILEALDNPYVPGTDNRFGIRLAITNKEEPAYGLKVNISLPMHPKRIPSDCSFVYMTMTCEFPQPFSRNEFIIWEIELDYNLNITEDVDLRATAKVSDIYYRNITEDIEKELVIKVTPEANFSISGKAMPNNSMTVLRSYLDKGADVSFKHYFEITNLGPSDWPSLDVEIRIPEKTNISAPIEGCDETLLGFICKWSIPAKVSCPVSISLLMDLGSQGDFLKENLSYNATSTILIEYKTSVKSFEITTTLTLEPDSIIWYIIVPCIFIGLILLGIIVRILQKRGFFLRKKHELLLRRRETLLLQEPEPISQDFSINEDENIQLDDDTE